ncbi:TraR/DksA family transcriptional regulator [Photobacterium damselae]|uniref:TraR/DksA family transcriptional regulator n=1 Tax=Photobacterium damselae subsp. damselae TaxID=85581 RepID=A0A7Y7Q8R1_PHODD|nr:TraR/DksA family transcriptional regulator [Photobacterium damselae]AWK84547.1 hypothetical protein BST98_21165 [Photobacterium damselae]KAB1184340.1 TraR/DksA family transcriptional regulator [Photobacterium damselae subsp. damselae]MBE8127818.1 TraR/DksA family transcriptional regulator [Photobacterium damselae subsp. piscicida]MCG3823438.1 TraR/DksA family transcriptional regulator [Photobacterium damselae]NVO60220.1 TraR/DksA family transcriptional regulator [Photobacterium damselae sub
MKHDIFSAEQLGKIKLVIIKAIDATKERIRNYDVSVCERDGYDQIDRANLEYDRNQNIILKNRDTIQLRSLETALVKIEQDPEDFGYCNSCGIEISLNRLFARPDSCYCLECMRIIEIKGKSNRLDACIN